MAITINGNGTVSGISSGAGKILQVVQFVETDDITFGTTLGTALSQAITPSSSSSKILVHWNMMCGRGVDDYGQVILYKNGSQISGAISTANTVSGSPNATQGIHNRGSSSGDIHFAQCLSGFYLDSPSTTSSTTYQMRMGCTYGANVYLNRAENFNAGAGHQVGSISTLTLMEISG